MTRIPLCAGESALRKRSLPSRPSVRDPRSRRPRLACSHRDWRSSRIDDRDGHALPNALMSKPGANMRTAIKFIAKESASPVIAGIDLVRGKREAVETAIVGIHG